MKRRKQRGMPSPSIQGTPAAPMLGLPRTQDTNHYYSTQMKSFNSSPDLQQNGHARKPSIDSQMTDYSKPNRQALLRPKTPPPPPPPFQQQQIYASGREAVAESTYGTAAPPPPPPLPETPIIATRVAPPPPPPPPPPNFLKAGPVKLETNKPVTPKTPETPSGAITAEALTSVRLKPVQSSQNDNNNNTSSACKQQTPGPKKSLDFDADLRNALAKRRSKVCVDETETKATVVIKEHTESTTIRYGGLSLRESVRENVQAPVIGGTTGGKMTQHSPPNFANKKDSG